MIVGFLVRSSSSLFSQVRGEPQKVRLEEVVPCSAPLWHLHEVLTRGDATGCNVFVFCGAFRTARALLILLA